VADVALPEPSIEEVIRKIYEHRGPLTRAAEASAAAKGAGTAGRT
jgi:ribosomal protein L12E/L44/L45/RPP1/RPP2